MPQILSFKSKILNPSFFAALFLLANSANSQTVEDNKPTFAVNGFVNFTAASRDQSSAFNKQTLPDGETANRLNNSQSIGNDSQFYFKTVLTDDEKNKYGAVAKVEFNINSDGRTERPNLDQAFLFSEHSFGKFEFGNNQAVNQKMKTGPARFARGAGGINGKYLEQINSPMLGSGSSVCSGGVGSAACSNVKLPRFILLAQSPIGHGGYAKGFYRRSSDNIYESASADYSAANRSHFRALKDDSFDGMEDATKLSYSSPRIAGLQLGASYTPDTSQNGITAQTAKDVELTRIENAFSFGANYSNYFDNIGIALSSTAEKGQVKNSKSPSGTRRADLFSYDFAATVTYFGFSFGASYGSWGNSLQAENGIYSCDYDSSLTLASQTCANGKKFKNPSYYTLGIAYEFGPFAASITSLASQFQKNNYQAISAGLDYKLAKGLTPYFEITKFSFKSNQPSASDVADQSNVASWQRQLKDNQGYVFLTGFLISF